jgi:hypothetical protein
VRSRVLLGLLAGAAVLPLAAQQRGGLVLGYNGRPLTDWLVLEAADSFTLTVEAHDSLGNQVPMTGFEIDVWDRGVLRVLATNVGTDQASVELAPVGHGQTTIQIRAAGLRSWVLAEYAGHEIRISPGQETPPVAAGGGGAAGPGGGGGGGGSWWTAGGRGSVTSYSYSFLKQTTFQGNAGFFAEGYFGREWAAGAQLVLGLGGGFLRADSVFTPVTVKLLEVYGRAGWVFLRPSRVRPAVELGAGLYRARTGGVGAGIWNTSTFFLVAGGVDATLGPKVIGEARFGTRQQWEETSKFNVAGHVASLFYFTVGARTRF